MYTGADLYQRYGDPATSHAHLIMLDVPAELEIGVIPRRIYCHRALAPLLLTAFGHLISRDHVDELRTWDGCYNQRPIRGYESLVRALLAEGKVQEAMRYMSVHSWAYAIDLNAAWNRLGHPPTLSAGFVQCWTDAGWEWGGTWKRADGMHFQPAVLL